MEMNSVLFYHTDIICMLWGMDKIKMSEKYVRNRFLNAGFYYVDTNDMNRSSFSHAMLVNF